MKLIDKAVQTERLQRIIVDDRCPHEFGFTSFAKTMPESCQITSKMHLSFKDIREQCTACWNQPIEEEG